MGIINWFKKWLNKDKDTSENEPEITPFDPSMVEIIHINPNVYLAHRAARICIGKGIDDDIDKRMTHLSNIIGVNKHESIAEHTNIIALLKIPKNQIQNNISDYAEFMSNIKYCNFSIRYDAYNLYILVGGSARAFMHLVRETNEDNFFLIYAHTIIYSSFESCFFKSLIDDNLLEKDKCTYMPDGEVKIEEEDAECSIIDPIEIEGEHVDLIYKSPIRKIYTEALEYGFSMYDVYKVSTISFLFHDISRTCSHQLVRHRNAISQESQRYVSHDYSLDDFVNPIILNQEERYSDRRFREVLEKTNSIINKGFNEYKWLLDHRVNKEDARAFLPSNTTTRLMMTMTYRNFAVFLKLRMDRSAQKEIHNIAEESAILTMSSFKEIDDFISYCNTPYWLKKKQTEQLVQDQIIVDDVIDEEPIRMEINTQEKAQDLLDKQEFYKTLEKNTMKSQEEEI